MRIVGGGQLDRRRALLHLFELEFSRVCMLEACKLLGMIRAFTVEWSHSPLVVGLPDTFVRCWWPSATLEWRRRLLSLSNELA